MRIIDLCGEWRMRRADEADWTGARVPGSVYSDLLAAGKMEDPYWRDNEMAACRLMDHEYLYERTFEMDEDALEADAAVLEFLGLDTLADVSVNGETVLRADNMHRTWKVDISDQVNVGENTLRVLFHSPTKFMEEAYQESFIDGSSDCTRGFPHLRKANCMSGWDWGPRLPDAGIWRPVRLLLVDEARLTGVRIHQTHDAGKVVLSFEPEADDYTGLCECARREYEIKITVTAPDGKVWESDGEDIKIDSPLLWWPNGCGDQPLYRVDALLLDEGRALDAWSCRIGLRTMTMTRQKDQFGESFDLTVNGVRIFAMGGDYIPEDNILSRSTPERTYRLIEDCKLANYNSIRVWGGGIYPEDWFYDACDEMGIVVWQDFMFACAMYELTPHFEENIRREAADNVRRLRHHASLGLWCGNNEMEWQVDGHVYKMTPKQYGDYIRMYEYIIPQVLREHDPDTFFWPASPSSGGGFDNPNDPNRGDVHYWEVWHGEKPFTDYRNYFFRYASEFGFQSFPCEKTVESFTLPEDRNVFSYVMEKHQRNNAANGKILSYLAQTFLYPNDFDTLLYASQLLQAEAIRYGVEHWRRNRGRCMGAIYWQTNDCWPVASWASIDYFGRWKALHYAAKRFFAPVLLSCQEEGVLTQNTNVNAQPFPLEMSAKLNLSNETMSEQVCAVKWVLRDPSGKAVRQGEMTAEVPALSALWLQKLDFSGEPLRERYFSYELSIGGKSVSSGSVLFCAPKHFAFMNPALSVRREGDQLVVTANAYARSVEILCEDGDPLFSDNFFDMNAGEKRISILRGTGEKFRARSVYDIR